MEQPVPHLDGIAVLKQLPDLFWNQTDPNLTGCYTQSAAE